jgi:hypothetical protein
MVIIPHDRAVRRVKENPMNTVQRRTTPLFSEDAQKALGSRSSKAFDCVSVPALDVTSALRNADYRSAEGFGRCARVSDRP